MQPHKLKQNHRIIGASILVTVSFILNKTLGYTRITIMVMAASTLIAGIPIFVNAVRAIRYWIVGIDALVTIAVIGAWFIGEYWEAAAVSIVAGIGNGPGRACFLRAERCYRNSARLKSLPSIRQGH